MSSKPEPTFTSDIESLCRRFDRGEVSPTRFARSIRRLIGDAPELEGEVMSVEPEVKPAKKAAKKKAAKK